MIHILGEQLISKIAAGEVIERPSSVVKELLENAIDAHADEIIVEIVKGGKEKIKVSDNGTGISKEDLKLAPLRHTTSKIATLGDLFNIKTLGFRGEGLASIASIANLKIISKINSDQKGYLIEVEEGKELRFEPAPRNKGTTVEVTDLFLNVPARYKYLKEEYMEAQYVTDIVLKYALMYPELHMRLIINGKETINAPKTTSLNNITALLGAEVSKHLLEINTKNMTGFISKPTLNKGDTSHQYVYINKRWIKNKIIQDAINDAYKNLLFHHRFPVFILNIDLSPLEYDVNVHPQKFEIRLKNEEKIHTSIRETLEKADLIPQGTEEVTFRFDKKPLRLERPQKSYFTVENQSVLAPDVQQPFDFKILGQVQKTYLLAEDEQCLYIIDQHALHERIYFNALLSEGIEVKKQTLLTPLLLETNPLETQVITNNWVELNRMGFVLEEFGINTFKLYSTPLIYEKQIDPLVIYDMLDELKKQKNKKIEEIKEEIIARMACRTAFKAGDLLTIPQIRKLLEEIKSPTSFLTCPHGRPVAIKFSSNELEKLFKRKVLNN